MIIRNEGVKTWEYSWGGNIKYVPPGYTVIADEAEGQHILAKLSVRVLGEWPAQRSEFTGIYKVEPSEAPDKEIV